MKELTEGKFTNKELAEWFGINASSFSNKKKNKLKELEYYAEFYEEKGKVIITKVLIPFYSKIGSQAYQMVRDKIDEVWSSTGLDSCKHVSDQIVKYYGEKLPVKESTSYVYTRKGRNELYGKPFMGGGILGTCTYEWCKKREDGSLEFLTEEEQKIKDDLIKKYFKDAKEETLMLKEMIKKGEITKEEAWNTYERISGMTDSNFLSFLAELETTIGNQVIRGTLVERSKFAETEV